MNVLVGVPFFVHDRHVPFRKREKAGFRGSELSRRIRTALLPAKREWMLSMNGRRDPPLSVGVSGEARKV